MEIKQVQSLRPDKASQKNMQIGGVLLPKPLIFTLFGMSRLQAARNLGLTSKAGSAAFIQYLREKLLIESHISTELIKEAESQGIQVNYGLLCRLSMDVQGQFNLLCRLTSGTVWPIAAVCGDIAWLKDNLKDTLKVVRCGSKKDVAFYLSFGGHLAIIDELFSDMLTAECYYIANAAGYFKLCDYIKEKIGESLPKVNSLGQHDVHFACQYGDLDRVKSLQESPSDISIFEYGDKWNNLPIVYATRGGALNVIRYIAKLDHKMAVEVDVTTGENLLHVAAAFGRAELIGDLITMGCDPKAKDHFENSPLQKSLYGNWRCFLALLPESDPYDAYIDEEYESMLFLAARIGAVEFIMNYLRHFGRRCLTYKGYDGSTFVHELMKCKNIRAIKTLYHHYNFSFIELDANGNTPLLSVVLDTDNLYAGENESASVSDSCRADWAFISTFFHIFRNQLSENILDEENHQGDTLRAIIVKNHLQDLFFERAESVTPNDLEITIAVEEEKEDSQSYMGRSVNL